MSRLQARGLHARGLHCAALAALLLFFSAAAREARAQEEDGGRFEIGGHVTVANLSNGEATVVTSVGCSPSPCNIGTQTTTSVGRVTEPGFGARIGYAVHRFVTVEAEANYLPSRRDLEDARFTGGSKVQGLVGVKVGRRSDSVGIFAKARPGFVSFSDGDLRPRRGGACVLVVPAPLACSEGKSRTDLALDLGGVVEFYPSKRAILRFDAGDTILWSGDHLVPVIVPPAGLRTFPISVVGGVRSQTTHNFQASVGFGVRF